MQIKIDTRHGLATGVLPSGIAKAYGCAYIFNMPFVKDKDGKADYSISEEYCSYEAKLAFLLKKFGESAEVIASDEEFDPAGILPIGLPVITNKGVEVLFLPPSCWKIGWNLKHYLCYYGDDEEGLVNHNGEKIGPEKYAKKNDEEKEQARKQYSLYTATHSPLQWIECQASQNFDSLETATTFKGIDLKSKGHKLLCEELERRGYMFSFESPTIVPDDAKKYRRIDLIVFHRQHCVIVEIDGSQHGEYVQRKDDYGRDRRITRHWANAIRYTHQEVVHNVDAVIEEIIDRLNPSSGKAHQL
nr:hypothetical protein 4 [bacterium]